MGIQSESRTKIACESVGITLARVFVFVMTFAICPLQPYGTCHGQVVQLASPETPLKDSEKKNFEKAPSTASAVVEAFDPTNTPLITSPEVGKPVAGKPISGSSVPKSRSPLPTKVATPDVSIAIERPGTIIKIPEKSLAGPTSRNPATVPPAASLTSDPQTQTKPAVEVVPSKIVASAQRSTPVVVRALESAPIIPEPAVTVDKSSVSDLKSVTRDTMASQPILDTLPKLDQPPRDVNAQSRGSDYLASPATATNPNSLPSNASPGVAAEQALTTNTSVPTTPEIPGDAPGKVASEYPADASTAIANSANMIPNVGLVSPENTATTENNQPAPQLAPQLVPQSPEPIAATESPLPLDTTALQTTAPSLQQDPRSPAETISPYWTTEGMLAIKAPPDRAAVVDLESLVWAALAHSPYVQSIKLTPMIRETEIQQAQGAFDPTRFVDSIWNDRSDPVGNTLTTGGPPRLLDKTMNTKGGIRSKNTAGGNFEASQEMILHNSNSLFFVPRQQADTKMFMRYTQPLMRGAGQAYNRATITIAELNTAAAGKDANQALQMHVMDLSESYWQLFYHRSQLLQLRRGVERLKVIASQLENRRDLDLLENQLFRAQAAVKTFESRIARTTADIIDDEQRIRRFVNAPWIQNLICDELITGSQPMAGAVVPLPEQELGAAFINRPDVLAIRDEIQSAKVKLNVAENELRPTLNLVTDMYVRGLNGQYDVANSFADQFSNGRPSYSGGLEYQRPRNLYLAKAIKRQRSLELQQILFRLEDQLLDVSREVLSAVAEVNAALTELNASVGSTMATKSELEYLESRWVSSEFLDTSQISLNLEQLMDAQQRLVNAEGSWALAQAQYMIALCRLRFSTGTLLTLGILDEPGVQPEEIR